MRFAPWAAGASPSRSTRAAGSPKPAIGRPQYVLVAERRALLRRHLLAPRDEPRAAAALVHRRLEGGERGHAGARVRRVHQAEHEALDDRLEVADVVRLARADLARGELDHRADDRERVVERGEPGAPPRSASSRLTSSM